MPRGNPKSRTEKWGRPWEDRDQDASTTRSSDGQDPSPDGDTPAEVMSQARKRVKQLKGDTANIERSRDVIQNMCSKEIAELNRALENRIKALENQLTQANEKLTSKLITIVKAF